STGARRPSAAPSFVRRELRVTPFERLGEALRPAQAVEHRILRGVQRVEDRARLDAVLQGPPQAHRLEGVVDASLGPLQHGEGHPGHAPRDLHRLALSREALGKTRLTSPRWRASAAAMVSPVYRSSRHRAPRIHGMMSVPTPFEKRDSTTPNFASSEAYRTSHICTNSSAPPRQYPGIMAITGLVHSQTR